MAVSKRLRYEILRRDNFACRYCGATAPDAKLTVDHVTPEALGGTDDPSNLATACEPCNSGKTSSTPDAAVVTDVADDALRWAEAMKYAAEELRAQAQPKTAYRDTFEQAWNEWTWEHNGNKKTFDLPANWKTSLDAFREAGLPVEVWPDIVEKAMTNRSVRSDNIFRYCCGIAWRMVRELQDAARRIAGDRTTDVPDEQPSRFGRIVVEMWAGAWLSEHDEHVQEATRDEFLESIRTHQGTTRWVGPDRLLKAALVGAAERCTTLQDCLAKLDENERAEVVIDWCDAWVDLGGAANLRGVPETFLYTVVHGQVDELVDGGVSLERVRRAAILAGYHHSAELHHGLRDSELEHTGVRSHRHMAADLWSRSFHAAANRWPVTDERSAFMAHIDRVATDGDFYLNDLLAAAVAAGAYQDPDLATCLPRHLSAFEAAASPLPIA